MGFGGNYTTQESINSVEVCVMVLTGYLGSVVTLQLSTISGTAEGKFTLSSKSKNV